jgi:hypothetical protein
LHTCVPACAYKFLSSTPLHHSNMLISTKWVLPPLQLYSPEKPLPMFNINHVTPTYSTLVLVHTPLSSLAHRCPSFLFLADIRLLEYLEAWHANERFPSRLQVGFVSFVWCVTDRHKTTSTRGQWCRWTEPCSDYCTPGAQVSPVRLSILNELDL